MTGPQAQGVLLLCCGFQYTVAGQLLVDDGAECYPAPRHGDGTGKVLLSIYSACKYTCHFQIKVELELHKCLWFFTFWSSGEQCWVPARLAPVVLIVG